MRPLILTAILVLAASETNLARQAQVNAPPTTTSKQLAINERNLHNPTAKLGQRFFERMQHTKDAMPAKRCAVIIKKQKAQNETEKSKETHPDKGSPTIDTWSLVEQKPEAKPNKGNTYDPAKDTLYRWYLTATVIGVFGALFGLCVLIWQSVLFRKNTQLLMNAERAHVDVEFVQGEEGTSWDFCVLNHGKTPAYLTMCIRSRHHSQDVYKLPADFRDNNRVEYKLIRTEMLPPTGKRTTLNTFDIGVTEAEKARKEKAMVRGFVIYNDVFENTHETEVIYEYRLPPGKLAKLHGYSKYT